MVMSNKVQLHPISLLFALMAMTELLGLFGALIATPTAALIKVLYQELYYRRLHGAAPVEEETPRRRLGSKRRKKADASTVNEG